VITGFNFRKLKPVSNKHLIQNLRQSAQAVKATNPLAARACNEAALALEDLKIQYHRSEREVKKWKSIAKDLEARWNRRIDA
jgi:hypothetical protein